MAEYVWEEADKTNPWGRKRAKGTHCSKGHEFTEENTFIRPYDKTRVCRECRRQYARKKYQDNKTAGKTKQKPLENFTYIVPQSVVLSDKSHNLYKKLQVEMQRNVIPCTSQQEAFDNPEHVTKYNAELMCNGCPIMKLCHDFAVSSKQEYGIWGGINFTKEVYKNGDEWFEDKGTIDWLISE